MDRQPSQSLESRKSYSSDFDEVLGEGESTTRGGNERWLDRSSKASKGVLRFTAD